MNKNLLALSGDNVITPQSNGIHKCHSIAYRAKINYINRLSGLCSHIIHFEMLWTGCCCVVVAQKDLKWIDMDLTEMYNDVYKLYNMKRDYKWNMLLGDYEVSISTQNKIRLVDL